MTTGWLSVLFPMGARAQELDPRLYPKFQVGASGTLLVLSETIRIDPQDGEGTEIDVEDVLGVSRTSLEPRRSLRWRPGRRHELEAGFVRPVRSGEKVLVDTISFADTTFVTVSDRDRLRITALLGPEFRCVKRRRTLGSGR